MESSGAKLWTGNTAQVPFTATDSAPGFDAAGMNNKHLKMDFIAV